MDSLDRRVVPIEEAIRRIGRKKWIHTFMQGGPALIGADHDREDVIAAMRTHGVEDSGASATAIGHTLVIVRYPVAPGRHAPLFIEAKPAAPDAGRGAERARDPGLTDQATPREQT
jgi:hypothetical protein